MNIAIIDYESGNISSVINSFKTVCTKQNIEIKLKSSGKVQFEIKGHFFDLRGQTGEQKLNSEKHSFPFLP